MKWFIVRERIVNGAVYIHSVCCTRTLRTLVHFLCSKYHWLIATSKPTGDKYSTYMTKKSWIFISRNEFVQWMDGAVVDLISIAGTASGLGLMMGSRWMEHLVSSPISSSPDIVASHFFFFPFHIL